MNRDPKERVSAAEALTHPWFATQLKIKDSKRYQDIDTNVFINLKNYNLTCSVKKIGLMLFVKLLDTKEMKKLKCQFL